MQYLKVIIPASDSSGSTKLKSGSSHSPQRIRLCADRGENPVGKVKADFRKGVLTVTVPKTAQAIKETKKITVKAG